MSQIPFAFEFECEWPNDLYMAELPFGCSEIFAPFLFKMAKWQLAGHYKILKNHIFECEWPNGNLNDLCTAELLFGFSHSQSNGN